MPNLNSDKKFLGFLRAQKSHTVILAVIVCAVGLVLLSGGVGGREESEASLEERTAQMCSSVRGVGECEVMITYSPDDEVYAVAVLCDGADDVTVRRELIELASTLFGIGSNKVTILKLSK